MTKFGIHEVFVPEVTKTYYTRVSATRNFVGNVITPQNLVAKFQLASNPTWAAGLTSYTSVKLSVNEVINDAWKPYVQELASYLKDNADKKTVFVLWHEPEDDFGASGFGSFVAYFNKVHGWIKEVYPELQTCHAANSYWYRQGGPIARPSDWKTLADINGTDVYSGNSFPLSSILPEQTAFSRWYEQLVGVGNPWAVIERGFYADATTSQLRADTIRREADWLATDPVGQLGTMYLAWNTSGQQGDNRLILDEAGNAAMLYLMNKIDPEPSPPPPPAPVLRRITQTCPLCVGSGNYTFEFWE